MPTLVDALKVLLSVPGMVLLVLGSYLFAVALGQMPITLVTYVPGLGAIEQPGLRGMATRWWRLQTALYPPGGRRVRRVAGAVPAIGAAILVVAISSFLFGQAVFVPYFFASSLMGIHQQITPPAGFIGLVLGVVSAYRGACYADQHKPRSHRSKLPPLEFPSKEVTRTGKVETAGGIYALHQVRFGADGAWRIVAFMFVFGLVDRRKLGTDGTSSAPPQGPQQNITFAQSVDIALALVGIALGIWLSRSICAAIERRMALYQVVETITHFLNDPPRTRRTKNEVNSGGIHFRIVSARDRLGKVATHLSLAATMYPDVDDASRHPMGTILEATATRLRHFLASPESLTMTAPPEWATQTLGKVLVAITGPMRLQSYTDLSELVGAFGADGSPAHEVKARRLNPWANGLDKVIRSVETSSKFLGALYAMFTLIVVLYFLWHGDLDLHKIQLQK
jgi:hypothetical protein